MRTAHSTAGECWLQQHRSPTVVHAPCSIKLGDLGGCGMPHMPPASGTYGDKRYLAHEGVTGLGGRTCSQGMTIDDLTKLDVFALGMSV
jgi:hypothetical protein